MRIVYTFLLTGVFLTFFDTLPLHAHNSESITITTYYPSPVGVYRTLRLFPVSSEKYVPPCEDNNEGFLYYNDIEEDDNQHRLMLCQETVAGTFQWRPVGEYYRAQQGGVSELTLTKIQQRLSTIEEEIEQIMRSYKTRQISEDKAKEMLRVLAKEEMALQNTIDYQAEQVVDSFFRGIKREEKK
ncbi:MAG: hypothetical protein WCI77_01300 [Candidatus Omnitrophota bacterium]